MPQNKCLQRVGRDDFNLTFMIFFGELPYDVGYQKKHNRPHGGGQGLLLYPAQTSPSWLNFFTRQKYDFFIIFYFFRKHCLHKVLNLHQLPNGAYRCYNCVTHILPTPCTSLTYVAENFHLRQGENCQNKPENHQN